MIKKCSFCGEKKDTFKWESVNHEDGSIATRCDGAKMKFKPLYVCFDCPNKLSKEQISKKVEWIDERLYD